MAKQAYLRVSVPQTLKSELWAACHNGRALSDLCVELLSERCPTSSRGAGGASAPSAPEPEQAFQQRAQAFTQSLEGEGPTVPVRIRVPASLRRALKVRAASLDVTVSFLCGVFLRDGLDARGPARPRPRAPSVLPERAPAPQRG